MKLESLKLDKFRILNNAQMSVLIGGADTGAGSAELYRQRELRSFGQDASGNPSDYKWVSVSYHRAWTSDADGCYWGERYYEVVH